MQVLGCKISASVFEMLSLLRFLSFDFIALNPYYYYYSGGGEHVSSGFIGGLLSGFIKRKIIGR